MINKILTISLAISCIMTVGSLTFAGNSQADNKQLKIKGAAVEKFERQDGEYWDPAVAAATAMAEEGRRGAPSFTPNAIEKPIPAVYVYNGAYNANKSKATAVSSGYIQDANGSKVKINAEDSGIGGIYVTGENSRFTPTSSDIKLSGNIAGLGGQGNGAAAKVQTYSMRPHV